MFTAMICTTPAERLRRPPWSCIATPELAIDWLGIHPQTMWNYRLRREGPEAEEDARRLYHKVGRRTIYRFESILSWLPTGGDRPPWHWARRRFKALGHEV